MYMAKVLNYKKEIVRKIKKEYEEYTKLKEYEEYTKLHL